VGPTAALAGLIEVRGMGVRKLEYEARAIVGLVVDLAAADAERLPAAGDTVISGIPLPRLAIAAGAEALQSVIAALTTSAGDIKPRS
jgi:phospholipid N-methyltransferase